jgi:hypothetical protein
MAHSGVDGVIIPGHCIGTSDPFLEPPLLKRNRAAEIQEFGAVDKERQRRMQRRHLRNQAAGWVDNALSGVATSSKKCRDRPSAANNTKPGDKPFSEDDGIGMCRVSEKV